MAEKKLKLTPQRTRILDYFLKLEGHISAEEMYDNIKKDDPSLGQATVYRTMKLLSDAGIAREVDFGDGIKRYEARLGHGHHDHLVCEDCREEVEFFDHAIEEMQEMQADKHGYKLTGHRMILFCICSKCQEN